MTAEISGAITKEDGDDRRLALVAAAYQIVAEVGFEGLRTRDVAARAGVNISTLHYYFATKEMLIQALVEYLSRMFAHSRADAAQAATPREQLRRHFDSARERLKNAPEIYRVLSELMLRAHRDPEVNRIMRQLQGRWREEIGLILRNGIEQGEFDAQMDVEAVAFTMTSFIIGTSVQLLMNPDVMEFDRVCSSFERLLRR